MLRIALAALSLYANVANCYVATRATDSVDAPVVQVKNGSYEGIYSAEYKQDFFLGVPYAQPPVGDLRFRSPVSLNQTWTGVKPAKKDSPRCVQWGTDVSIVSEDCLYINIVRPSGLDKNASIPVMIWIHGGGFVSGAGVEPVFNMTFLVQQSVKIGKPVIGINLNYRLGTFGFLSGSDEVKDFNVGLLDQRKVLEWVQENVASFGGDPKRVTIFGESAGAGAVGYQLIAHGGRDDKLFRGAIMESGNPINVHGSSDKSGSADNYNELIRRTGCDKATSPLECLRTLPYQQLYDTINQSGNSSVSLSAFGPVIDGDFLRKPGSVALAAGEFIHIPIMSGATSDEGTAFSSKPVNTEEEFEKMVIDLEQGKMSADFAKKILTVYPDDLSVNVVQSLGNQRPSASYGAQFRRSATYIGDLYIIAPRRKTCETWAANNLPVYSYRFDVLPDGANVNMAVTHFAEVSFVFNNYLGIGYGTKPFSSEPMTAVANFMTNSWLSYVYHLDPNEWRKTVAWSGLEPEWPVYNSSNPTNFVFDSNRTSYLEPDVFRKEAIQLINDNSLSVYGR
ncbi:carboxylic ester hydrolase [Parastagonospora nodorum]|nr:carboxylic ester hydrolase [Parastagonospora nodorum]KAH4672657.1 carboxylic ester hydrolase [Parastagonospora nodorum]KAH4697177.1 carboxylic ester hydrolase [Parastagonospora nodorum]KAH4765272.1 carboxylic ester hydrolase [Parastagonospora nodorum]KAH4773971.1 carboxylic ester hydrolase [Parastagonospora nodorum]